MELLSDGDIGKQVFDSDENLLGEIVDVGEDGTASVRPNPEADEATLSPFGWEGKGEHRMPSDYVDDVTSDGVYAEPL